MGKHETHCTEVTLPGECQQVGVAGSFLVSNGLEWMHCLLKIALVLQISYQNLQDVLYPSGAGAISISFMKLTSIDIIDKFDISCRQKLQSNCACLIYQQLK